MVLRKQRRPAVPFHPGERLTFVSDLLHGPRLIVEVVEVTPGELPIEQAVRASWSVLRTS
jgi:hypothetical protein